MIELTLIVLFLRFWRRIGSQRTINHKLASLRRGRSAAAVLPPESPTRRGLRSGQAIVSIWIIGREFDL